MNQLRNFFGLLFLALFFVTTTAEAQRDVDDAMSDSSPLSGLHIGGYGGLFYFNGWNVDVSPGVGYRVRDWLITGVGVNVSYQSRFDIYEPNDKISSFIWGPRAFAKFNVFQEYYGIVEYQYNIFNSRYETPSGFTATANYCEDNPGSTNCTNRTESAFLIGGGFSSSFGRFFSMYYEFTIDLMYDRLRSPKGSPLLGRLGFYYTFP